VRVPAHEPAPGAVPADPGPRQQGWFTVCTCKESAGRPAPKRAFQRTMNVVPVLACFSMVFSHELFHFEHNAHPFSVNIAATHVAELLRVRLAGIAVDCRCCKWVGIVRWE